MIFFISATLGLFSAIAYFWYLGGMNRYCWFRPLGLFWLFYFVHDFIPALYVYETTGWSHYPHMAPFPIMVYGAPLLIILGALVVGRVRKETFVAWWNRPTTAAPSHAQWAWIIFGIGLLLLITHIILVKGKIPLLMMVTGQSSGTQLARAREEALKLLPFGVSYLIRWNLEMILPFAALSFLVLWAKKRTSALPFIVTGAAAAFQAMFSVARSPIAVLFVKCVLLYFAASHRKVRIPWVVATIVAIFGFALTVNILKYDKGWSLESVRYQMLGPSDSDQFITKQSLIGRAFYTPSWTIGAHVSHAPEYSGGFLHGRSIGWYTRLTGQESYPLSLLVMSQYKEGNETGIANTCYVGDAWANFGWLGVIGYSLILGAWLAMIEKLLIRLAPTPGAMAVWTLASMQAMVLAHTAFQNYLMTFGALPLAIVIWMMGRHQAKTYHQLA